MTHLPPSPAAVVVLDTNVVLDWLVFTDPSVTSLASSIASGALCWNACPCMRTELADVLNRPMFRQRGAGCERILTHFDRLTREVLSPPRDGSPPDLRCTDPDDQIFVDLALACRARWLFTRDRALLALARAARAHGLGIVRPEQWSPDHALTPAALLGPRARPRN
jgi:predicted nucleic acid-binding protein